MRQRHSDGITGRCMLQVFRPLPLITSELDFAWSTHLARVELYDGEVDTCRDGLGVPIRLTEEELQAATDIIDSSVGGRYDDVPYDESDDEAEDRCEARRLRWEAVHP